MLSRDATASGRPEGSLTDTLWRAAAPVYEHIRNHPFLNELTAGTLPRAAFRFYILQDALYLTEYARALATLAGRGPREATELFGRHATDALAVERALHAGIMRDLGLDDAAAAKATMAPTCRAYTSYLLASVALESFPEGLAAVLPCYWIYQRVGQELAPAGSPEPLYQSWIDTYAGEEFDATVRAVLDLTDAQAERISAPVRKAMVDRYLTCSRYEWMFWDMAYRREVWPV